MMTFFKIYTFVFAGLLLLSLATKILMKLRGSYDRTPDAVQIEEALMMPFMLVALLGCFGYVFQSALFGQVFWQAYVVVFILLSLASYWMPKFQWMKSELAPRKFAISFLVLSLMNLPFFYMLIDYAYLSYPAA
ncbi:hypothetical protein A3709_16450 [Halioglobus sp. HI00S01]|uniref:hypothetical protein n=1 Tax=Halioglobus sp. HI00S01 TaxID=1822214 RepID=UPI0007C29495|nr:hypothetical protein [Halioglobus sp. HI00S01]KZX59140.1 hypothetical protein A3709_16450 [Halioglobus sp. HI00S01]